VSEGAGIETGTVATLALAVRRSNHSASRSHPAISFDVEFASVAVLGIRIFLGIPDSDPLVTCTDPDPSFYS
jgi:hypothetical protein